MKYNELDKDLQQKVVQILEESENKSEAIVHVADMISSKKYEKLISELTEQSERAAADEEYRKTLNLRTLSKEEKEFYESFKDIKQAVTTKQIDILPTSIIERTMEDVQKASDILSLVNFTPADVKHWITGTHSGDAVWGDIVGNITGELSAEIKGLNIEQHRLNAYIVIPKAIRDLALPFVDKYFRAILAEAMQNGLVKGYLNGNGKDAPVGIFNKIESFTTSGTAQPKSKLTSVTKLSPKGLAGVRKTLSNNGKRTVTELELICNPLDEAEYVDPALFGEALTGGYRNTSFMPINKHVDPNCPQGSAAFTLKGVYTMGISGVKLTEYDQTKAMEDADLIIGKCYGNGRADDDNCAVVFDVTKLEEYKLPVTQVTGVGA